MIQEKIYTPKICNRCYASKPLRIAVFSPYKVWPNDNGGRVLIAGGCEYMSRAGAVVRCFALRTLCESPPRESPPFDYVEKCAWLSILNGLDRFRLSKVPFIKALGFYTRRMAEWAVAFEADLVEVHMPWLMGVRRWLPKRIPVVYHAQNVEAEWYEPILSARRFSSYFSRLLKDSERRALQYADYIFTVTGRDAQELARRYGVESSKLVHHPPGVVIADTSPRSLPSAGRRRRAAFCGSRFSDNVAAALRIIQQLAGACREEWDFEIAGSVCEELVSVPRPENVRILGFVPDLPLWLSSCDVFVHPVRMVTGINMKLLSALSCRLPVVATPEGARGFESFTSGAVKVVELDDFPDAMREIPLWGAADEARLGSYAWPTVIEERLSLYRKWVADFRSEPLA